MSASVQRVPGVLSADLNFASGTLLIEYEPMTDPRAQVVKTVESSGHALQSLEEGREGEQVPARPWYERYRAEISTVGSGVFAFIGILAGLLGLDETVSTVAFLIAIAFGGFLIWRRAMVSIKARIADMNVLMSVAVIGAVLLGEHGEGASVFFLFALGGLLESRSLERTRRSIRELMELTPPVARVRRNDELVEIGLAEVVPGDVVVVRPGERVPVDGAVRSGGSAVDESAITGESMPAQKEVGDVVYAGTLNTYGLIEVVSTALASDSTLARVVYMVEEAQATKAPSQTFVDKFSRYYTPIVMGLAALVAIGPPLLGPLVGLPAGDWAEWIHRALVMLVVSCPCALVISTPVSVVSGITRASRSGILVKGGVFLEAASRVSAIAFDKTGTITSGRLALHGVRSLTGGSEDELLQTAASLEVHSSHPIARAVVSAASRLELLAVSDFEEQPGVGVSGTVAGASAVVCSPASAEQASGWNPKAEKVVAEVESSGSTALVLLRDGVPEAVLAVGDTVRPEAAGTVSRLKTLGIEHLVMLTGDNERVGEAVAAATGLTGFLARLLPSAKTDSVRVLQERYGVVAMVGDGINDAPALAAADIGIAMGAVASDTALETADVALMSSDLGGVATFLHIGRATMRTIVVNVAFSILVKAVFLVLALTGQATLWMAVFADTGVSLLVILNAMRLLALGDAPQPRDA